MGRGQNCHFKMSVKHLSIKANSCVYLLGLHREDWTGDLKVVYISINMYLKLWAGRASQESRKMRESPWWNQNIKSSILGR